MTSILNAENDARIRDEPSHAPLERRTTSTSHSGSNHRFSFQSSDTGESSKAASVRNHSGALPNDDVNGPKSAVEGAPLKNGGGSHRSHRSRNSGGFLLSSTTFEPPPTTAGATDHPPKRNSTDHKGKAALRSPEKRHLKRRSGAGPGIGGSPLAANVTIAGTNGVGGDSTTDRVNGIDSTLSAKPTPVGLDVDSAQIVHLALNLSESRKAARRNVSSPLPPPTPPLGESFAGGSLRHHLQQQRRVSRNVSPKPDRGDRLVTASPRVVVGSKMNGPLSPAFESDQDGHHYQYHFSASTLARAENAKNSIELMAHYRRLLQYVPPLKPQALERATIAASVAPDPLLGASRTPSVTASVSRQLGRDYNPLQYIRNRKVRARERRAIDGEAQGFGDVDKVTSWVDQVAMQASSEVPQATDCLLMPSFSTAAGDAASPHNSPPSATGKAQAAQAKSKRPRVDWITNPADMIADIFWLEQGDNKKSVEDRHGRTIFPQSTELKRPLSRRSTDRENPPTSGSAIQREQTMSKDLRIDTKLPAFRSIRADSEKHSDSSAFRAKQKLREATRMHGHNGSIHHHRIRVQSLSKSDPDSSGSEAASRPLRKRSATAGSDDRGADILEKQMMEMLANESRKSTWSSGDVDSRTLVESVQFQRPTRRNALTTIQNADHSRSGSITDKETQPRRESLKNDSSGRPSLEVPGLGLRVSVEGLDSSTPNSPQMKASKVPNSYVTSIGSDVSPSPHSRPSTPLSKVKSRFSQLQDYSRDRSRSRASEVDPATIPTKIAASSKDPTLDSPVTPEKQKRSMSPIKKVSSGDSSKSSIRKGGSIRKGKAGDEASGIRGLFKGSRKPIARVSDFIWGKEPSSVGPASDTSTDDSDVEDLHTGSAKESWNSSIAIQRSSDDIEAPSPLREKPLKLNDFPVFTHPFLVRRGREQARSDELAANARRQDRQAREERRKSSRAHMLEPPPRIDVQNASPTSSPEVSPQRRYERDLSISDVDSRRSSFATGVYGADARLNAILGIPGQRGNILFATGLAALEASNHHRPSLEGKRQWSISDRAVSVHRGPMTKQEIARVKALLLSSGIKANEIARRAAEPKDLRDTDEKPYADIASMARREVTSVPKSQQHLLAARILAEDIQFSSSMWQASADNFTGVIVQPWLDRIDTLRDKVVGNLTPMARKAADEADEVSIDLVIRQTLTVKRITDAMDRMMRRRRRRFRWLRRGGWLIVEWALVGVMWLVWFVVVFVRVVMGIGNGVIGVGRWLLFL